MSRPVVSVFDIESADSVASTVTLPAVFTAPIRADVVHYVHTLMAKNKRQAYAVSTRAGMQVMHCCFINSFKPLELASHCSFLFSVFI